MYNNTERNTATHHTPCDPATTEENETKDGLVKKSRFHFRQNTRPLSDVCMRNA